jgi:hypothetical protein
MQSDYVFNHLGRIGSDNTDMTQRTLQNTHFSNLVLTNYFRDKMSTEQINFATQYPGLDYTGSIGSGVGGALIDNESKLLLSVEQERPLEKLQLFSRPFNTVPYLGRGSCDPTLESQLLQGEVVRGKKSVTTVMDKNYASSFMYPLPEQVNAVEELALGGWNRGGMDTRTTGDKYPSK